MLQLPTFRVDLGAIYGSKTFVEPRMDPFGNNFTAAILDITTVPPSVLEEVQWFDESKTLVLRVSKNINSNALLLVSIPKSAGMTSSSDVARDTPRHTISAFIQGEYVPPTAILRSDLIRAYGAVVQSSIAFDPASTLKHPNPQRIAVYIQFSVDLDLFEGDFVDVILPGFSLITSDGEAQWFEVTSEPILCVGDPIQCTGSIREGFWYESESRLSLRIVRYMPAFQNVTVWIPSDVGMQVPEYGLTSFVASLRIKANVLAGVIPGLDPITYVQPVGYFTKSPELAYQVPDAGKAMAVDVSFTTNLNIFKDDTLSILLSGFQVGEPRASIVPVEPSCALAKASWQQRRLSITFGSEIKPRESLTVSRKAGVAFLPALC
jgi:hypothetical protein